MSIIAAVLLPIIVISHLTAQWYLFHFIGYYALSWMRSTRKEKEQRSQRKRLQIAPFSAFRRWLLWGASIAVLLIAVVKLA